MGGAGGILATEGCGMNRSLELVKHVARRRGWAAPRATWSKIRARAVPLGTSHAPLRRGEAVSGALERFRQSPFEPIIRGVGGWSFSYAFQ
jgi:hypothetical protein